MTKRLFFAVVSLFGFLIISACTSSKHHVYYSYSAPNEFETKQCINECSQQRIQCQKKSEFIFSSCEAQVNFDSYSFENNRVGCDEKNYACQDNLNFNAESFSHLCRLSYRECQSTFNACYETCGGQVEAKTVCVENCN